MTESQPPQPVSQSRIDAVVEVLSMIAVGEMDMSKIRSTLPDRHDNFGEIEQLLRTLASDLGEVLAANEQYTNEIEETASQLQDKLATIERQQLAIHDLSTPVLEIWTDVLTLPIVGVVDTKRSIDMTERLLHAIVARQAKCVIIDITGVDLVDTATADHFVKMIRASAMLGAHCVVCGISPDVAQTLTRIGVELQDVHTLRSLKDALRHCLRYLQRIDADRKAVRRVTADRTQNQES